MWCDLRKSRFLNEALDVFWVLRRVLEMADDQSKKNYG
jgi:hypothetical protein